MSPSDPYHIYFLKNDLEERKARNPRYSLRAYSRALGIDAAAMSRILNGKQDLSLKACREILKKLTDDPAERERLLESVLEGRKAAAYDGVRSGMGEKSEPSAGGGADRAESDAGENARTVPDGNREDAYSLALLELMALPNYDADPKIIAERLRTSTLHAKWLLGRVDLARIPRAPKIRKKIRVSAEQIQSFLDCAEASIRACADGKADSGPLVEVELIIQSRPVAVPAT